MAIPEILTDGKSIAQRQFSEPVKCVILANGLYFITTNTELVTFEAE